MWGIVDVSVAVMARRAGPLAVTLGVHATSLCLLILLALVLDVSISLSTAQWAAVAVFGPTAGLAYLMFYKALSLGPVAIVSPIASANGVVVCVLAVALLGESLNVAQAFGCAVVLGCVCLAAAGHGTSSAGVTGAGGPRLAVLASASFGAYFFVLAALSTEIGWLTPILLTRIGGVLALSCLTVRMRVSPLESARRADIAILLIAGALEAAGYLLWNRGASLGEAALTTAAASAYPVVPILFGLIVFGERFAIRQAVGVGGVLAGMLLLNFG